MDFLDPSTGNIDRNRIIGEETMSVSDGYVVRFHRLIGEGRGHKAIDDGVNQ